MSWEWCLVPGFFSGKTAYGKAQKNKNSGWKVKQKKLKDITKINNDGQQFCVESCDRTLVRHNMRVQKNRLLCYTLPHNCCCLCCRGYLWLTLPATSLQLIYCRNYWLFQFHMKGSRLNMEPPITSSRSLSPPDTVAAVCQSPPISSDAPGRKSALFVSCLVTWIHHTDVFLRLSPVCQLLKDEFKTLQF